MDVVTMRRGRWARADGRPEIGSGARGGAGGLSVSGEERQGRVPGLRGLGAALRARCKPSGESGDGWLAAEEGMGKGTWVRSWARGRGSGGKTREVVGKHGVWRAYLLTYPTTAPASTKIQVREASAPSAVGCYMFGQYTMIFTFLLRVLGGWQRVPCALCCQLLLVGIQPRSSC